MKSILTIIAVAVVIAGSAVAEVKDNPCVVAQSAIGISMLDAMDKDMKIDIGTILHDKTKTELITNETVTYRLAEQFAVTDKKLANNKWLSLKDYLDIFSENNARNLIIKFTFENKRSQHDIFLASALVNDNECSVRFNGYIIVKREF
ncbi:Shiga toxin A subunit [Cedecea sp. FDAARGOS_727]|uniref:Shiga toxin A subunit n=1 Tax=Cedecea sp. FDAARGOS_727 TaxID=2545798 RepID=UPI00143EBC25|nr:Shiga toxin A subunit [Cedecea sp. FDAARGOS_727]QIX94947.1 Shiga toxin A subunit [Cedecea sp. FDAARGOS_727]